MLERITHEDFARRLHDRFQIELDAMTLDLELVSVEPAQMEVEDGRRQPFSLVFCGIEDALLPQRLYPLRHAELGILEIFLVPIGPDEDGRMRYEAVFT